MLLTLLLACPTKPTTDGVEPKTTSETGSPTTDTSGSTETGTTETGSTTETGTPGPCALPSLQIGNGAEEHIPLSDDDTVVVVKGDQGGWHIDVSGLVGGTTGIISVLPTVTRISDGLQLAGDQPPTYLALVDTGACEGEFSGVRAFIDDPVLTGSYEEFICTLGGEALELRVEIEDLKAPGSIASGTVRVIAANDPESSCP
ncbi:MAG TPA: hypothetical protein ENK18_27495 [Deltaproteobacteria bacterium]|nr:hypothetical protein [Deltaproteobacteria bacterium]